MNRLEPQTGTAFELRAGQQLRVIDLDGEQVADLTAFNRSEKSEWLSSGRSIDYANRIYLTKGDILYSNRSRTDAHNRRGRRRPARFPSHSVQSGNVRDHLQNHAAASELLR
jgi:uncharacterized protein YcgI (DUF1989 family)